MIREELEVVTALADGMIVLLGDRNMKCKLFR